MNGDIVTLTVHHQNALEYFFQRSISSRSISPSFGLCGCSRVNSSNSTTFDDKWHLYTLSAKKNRIRGTRIDNAPSAEETSLANVSGYCAHNTHYCKQVGKSIFDLQSVLHPACVLECQHRVCAQLLEITACRMVN